MLFHSEKEWNSDTLSSMGEWQMFYAQWRKPDSEKLPAIQYGSIYMTSVKQNYRIENRSVVASSWVKEDRLTIKGHLGICIGGDRTVLYLDCSGSYSSVSTLSKLELYIQKSEFYSL